MAAGRAELFKALSAETRVKIIEFVGVEWAASPADETGEGIPMKTASRRSRSSSARFACGACLVLCVTLARDAYAATVEKVNGQKLRGEVVKITDDYVVLRVKVGDGSAEMRIALKDVHAVTVAGETRVFNEKKAPPPKPKSKSKPKPDAKTRQISMSQYVDKMKAGWIGQMAGVGLGAPTEFKLRGGIFPLERIPKWKPGMVNQFWQDDIYVEMTFMETLDDYGFDVSIRQAGIDFANSGYKLWHANVCGRKNLRKGIAPPDSGHPRFNRCADDIDYQIEADYSGLIAPGMPQIVVELGEKFGRVMNYGDGVYAGQFVGAMYSEAFFETDVIKIIKAALKSIPPQSQYAEMVRDVLQWHRAEPNDWQKVWHIIEEKYHKNPAYTHGKCSRPGGENKFSIDAKLNGSYILLGLLYGKGDLDETMIISTRCGQDSDCNPSNAAGVLFTTIGFSKLPKRFVSALDSRGKFSHTRYDFPGLVEASKKLVRQAVLRCGGRVTKGRSGGEVLVIPIKPVRPSALMSVKNPGPIANSRYSPEEKAKIKP